MKRRVDVPCALSTCNTILWLGIGARLFSASTKRGIYVQHPSPPTPKENGDSLTAFYAWTVGLRITWRVATTPHPTSRPPSLVEQLGDICEFREIPLLGRLEPIFLQLLL